MLVELYLIWSVQQNIIFPTQQQQKLIMNSSTQFFNDQPSKSVGIDIAFKDITYTVQVAQDSGFKLPCFQSKTKKILLNNISGVLKAGEVAAIMGASGAGKTTLLNVLACRVPPQNQEGEIFANSLKYSVENFGDFANYVMQNDILIQTMTVRETLEFAATLKLNASESQKATKVMQLAKSLKLQNCLQTLVGGQLVKGISGGQKKRTSIAFELISDPQVIMLDEPTSGLDSLTSYVIVKYLSDLAIRNNKTVIMTIHQPNSQIFSLFNKLVLMVEGRLVYQGPAQFSAHYFARNFNLVCPEFHNPADFFMSVIHQQDPSNVKRYPQYMQVYQQTLAKQIDEQIERRSMQVFKKRQVKVQFSTSYKALVRRDFNNILRNPLMIKSRFFQVLILTIYVSGLLSKFSSDYKNPINWSKITGFFFFFSINSVFIALTPITLIFPTERLVFLKEQSSKLYDTLSYFLSRNTVEIPYGLIFPSLQALIMYWFVGMDASAEQFWTFWFIIFLLNFAGMSFGLFVGSIVRDAKAVSGFTLLVVFPFLLFSGFFKNTSNLSNWISWIQYISPFKYGFSAFVQNQVLHKESLVRLLNFDVGLWPSIGCLIAIGISFRIGSLFFLWRLRTTLQ